MIGIGMRAAGEIRRQTIRLVSRAARILILQSGLFSVGPAHPSEEVVEAPVFHGHHDDVFNARLLGRKKLSHLIAVGTGEQLGRLESSQGAGGHSSAGACNSGKKLSAIDCHNSTPVSSSIERVAKRDKWKNRESILPLQSHIQN